MILEIDCGNTLLKWRVLGRQAEHALWQGTAQGEAELLAQMSEAGIGSLLKGRIASVRAEDETNSLVSVLHSKYSIQVDIAESTKTLAGVTNGYLDYTLLGVDRWLAIVGAFVLRNSACLVLDVGTAVTADFVDAVGVHLGGFICPGIRSLRNQLGISTARVAYFPGNHASDCDHPGRQTLEAVERGTELMLVGFVGAQVRMAHEFWGADYSLILTGGDAALVKRHFNEAITVPDLVFRGLALACPD